jgi:hypothetical protein
MSGGSTAGFFQCSEKSAVFFPEAGTAYSRFSNPWKKKSAPKISEALSEPLSGFD